MFRSEEISSLTDFKRDTAGHLKRLAKSGQPRVLTINGRAKVVVQDAAAYQRLLDQLDRAETIAGIRRGLASFARGEGRPAREALEEAFRKIKAARRPRKRQGRAA